MIARPNSDNRSEVLEARMKVSAGIVDRYFDWLTSFGGAGQMNTEAMDSGKNIDGYEPESEALRCANVSQGLGSATGYLRLPEGN